MNKDSKPSFSKKTLIIVSAVGVIVVWAILSLVIPLMMSDGTDAYSGAEKEAATNALTEFGSLNNGIDRINHLDDLKARVEQVKSVMSSDVGCAQGEDGHLIVISHRTFFGIQTNVTIVTPCAVKYGQSLEALYPNL